MNGRTEEKSPTLERLIALAAKPPAKNVKELSQVVSAMAMVLISMHLKLEKLAGSKETNVQLFFTRVVAPLVVAIVLYMLLDLGPAILTHMTNP